MTSPGTSPGTSHALVVDDWSDLDRLREAMLEVDDQLAATVDHAVLHMCRPDGFAPSPACLLRPLSEVMELIGSALEAGGRAYRQDWRRTGDDVLAAARELRASDVGAADRSHRLGTALAHAGVDESA